MTAATQEQPQIKLLVEDPRPGSGHMQSCYPSPLNGHFESLVDLGQRVEPGQVLGRVVDAVNHQSHLIQATQEGWVLVIRAMATVKHGDSLAVVVEEERTGAGS